MSSRRPGRREPRDGRTLRIVDETFWAREREMLGLRLSLLTEFVGSKALMDPVELQAEECRYLEYQIQCLNASLCRAGKDEDARDYLERRIQGDSSGRLERFNDWLVNNQEFKTLMLSHQTELPSLEDSIEGQYKCFDFRCKHYVYGFETADALRRHMELHEAASHARVSSSTIQKRTSNMSLDDSTELPVTLRTEVKDYEPSSSDERNTPVNPPFQKRTSLLSVPDQNAKRQSLTSPRLSSPTTTKSSGPCLRCKVLKKKCDCLSPCKECPQQDVMAPDLWKALGCFHGPLTELSKKCLQAYQECLLRAPDNIALDLDVSYSDSNTAFWTRELDDLMNSAAFHNLEDECWDERRTIAFSAETADVSESTELPDATYQRLLADYGPAVGLLKVASMDSAYYAKSAFNPFALFRLGKSLSSQCRDQTNWQLHTLANTLLVTVIRFREEFSGLETTIRTTLDKSGPDSLGPMTLPDIETPLVNFLRAFELRFSNRKELSVEGWLGSFYALCVLSIVKSILIDTSQPRQPKERQASYAAQLANVYKVLVSVFSWSAKLNNWCPKEYLEIRDPLLHNWSTNDGVTSHSISPLMQDGLRATQELTKQALWGTTGIKHTKDFLLSLGSGQFLDHGFNGFLVQVYGESVQFVPVKPRRRPSTIGMDIDESDGKERIASTPVDDSEPTTRPRAESRSSTTGRRSTFPETPKERDSAPEKSAMGPPDRDPLAGRESDAHSSGWRPSAKSLYAQELGRTADATEDAGYYSAPPRSSAGIKFTAVTDGAVRESEQRAKMQRRDSRSEDFSGIVDAHLKNIYKADGSGGGKRGENHRVSPGLAGSRHTDASSYALNRFQNSDAETPYVPLDSYYRHQLPQPSSEELYHKRRHGSADSRKGDAVPMALEFGREEKAKKGLEEGTMTFALSEKGTLVRKAKRRELSKEQREHAAAVRRLGACPECKARKIKCSPSHHRGNDGERESGSPKSPTAGLQKRRKTESPEPSPPSREGSTEDTQPPETLVVAMEE